MRLSPLKIDPVLDKSLATIMAKSTLQYTTKDLREVGFFVEVPGRTDTDKTRKKALEEIQRRMDAPEDTSLNAESFADGLSTDDLILVEQPSSDDSDEEEPEMIQAVKAIATLASLRVTLEEASQSARELRPLIEALFAPEPLTSEQIQQATDKAFAKNLIKFAEAKAAHDKFLPTAETAWQIVAPALPANASVSPALKSETETSSPVSEANPDASKSKNGQKVER